MSPRTPDARPTPAAVDAPRCHPTANIPPVSANARFSRQFPRSAKNHPLSPDCATVVCITYSPTPISRSPAHADADAPKYAASPAPAPPSTPHPTLLPTPPQLATHRPPPLARQSRHHHPPPQIAPGTAKLPIGHPVGPPISRLATRLDRQSPDWHGCHAFDAVSTPSPQNALTNSTAASLPTIASKACSRPMHARPPHAAADNWQPTVPMGAPVKAGQSIVLRK
jgi:hypothetical protein